MAREMALAGVDKSELMPPPPPKKPDTLKGKWENFWYHYKWITIAVILALGIAGWFVYQQITANPADYEAVVVTEQPLLPEETDALCALLASGGEDLDGDGTVEVSIENLNPSFYDEMAPTVGHSDMQKLMSYLSTGDRMLFVFDKKSYDGFAETARNVAGEDYRFFAPLDTADEAYDADQHFWSWRNDERRLTDAFELLPQEMYFGVRAPSGTAENTAAQSKYEQGSALLLNLIKAAHTAE